MEPKRKPIPGLRVDKWIGQRFPQLTNRHIEEALAGGLVLGSGGRHLKKGDKVPEEVALDTARLGAWLEGLTHGNPGLRVDVVGETDAYWVVDKPAGIPSHPISLFDRETITQWAFARRPQMVAEFPQTQPTVTPHRLDTSTSGLLIVAKSFAGYEDWRSAFSQKLVQKRYLAWCWGSPSEDAFEIHQALSHDPADNTRMTAAVATGPRVLAAHTFVRVRVRLPLCFLAQVECKTGVMHQVRAHLALRGFPLIGDALYDNVFSTRASKPPHHKLRAVEIKRGSLVYQAPSEKFEREFF